MSDTGIGARVKRKEDHRFITGKGRYTDDINLKDQTYGYFVRSPHAHADDQVDQGAEVEAGRRASSRCSPASMSSRTRSAASSAAG